MTNLPCSLAIDGLEGSCSKTFQTSLIEASSIDDIITGLLLVRTAAGDDVKARTTS